MFGEVSYSSGRRAGDGTTYITPWATWMIKDVFVGYPATYLFMGIVRPDKEAIAEHDFRLVSIAMAELAGTSVHPCRKTC